MTHMIRKSKKFHDMIECKIPASQPTSIQFSKISNRSKCTLRRHLFLCIQLCVDVLMKCIRQTLIFRNLIRRLPITKLYYLETISGARSYIWMRSDNSGRQGNPILGQTSNDGDQLMNSTLFTLLGAEHVLSTPKMEK